MLQSVELSCIMLQCVTECCSVLQCDAPVSLSKRGRGAIYTFIASKELYIYFQRTLKEEEETLSSLVSAKCRCEYVYIQICKYI